MKTWLGTRPEIDPPARDNLPKLAVALDAARELQKIHEILSARHRAES
jgi:hypothetical protein